MLEAEPTLSSDVTFTVCPLLKCCYELVACCYLLLKQQWENAGVPHRAHIASNQLVVDRRGNNLPAMLCSCILLARGNLDFSLIFRGLI